MKLLYLANIRLPTEKAHGLQIMENCDAFAEAGAKVTLWAARRWDRGPLAGRDPFAHYGIPPRFRIRRLPTLDLLGLVPGQDSAFSRLLFGLQLVTYLLSAVIGIIFTRADVYYSRDERVIALLGLFIPARRLAYEPHSLAHGRIGRWLQRRALRCAGAAFPVTALLADDLAARGADHARLHVMPDGIRAARFAHMPDQAAARAALGWPADAFIVGYVGRLHTMGMGKGVDTLVKALAGMQPPVTLALVGGPDDHAADLRAAWIGLGGAPEHFLYAGQLPAANVPAALSAFDVCALPLPVTEHFARHASPLKLFEYMASGRTLIATALPGFMEIVTDDVTALLIPPDDPAAASAAVRRLYADPALRLRLGAAAQAEAFGRYTWRARAERILAQMQAISA